MCQRTLKGPSDLGANVQGTVCSAPILKRPVAGEECARKDRRHPLEQAPYLWVDPPVGLSSRARMRAKEDFILYSGGIYGVSLAMKLLKGILYLELMLIPVGERSWDPSVREGDGVHVSNSFLGAARVALNSGPEEVPRAAAAIWRQQGVSESGHPDLSKK